MLLESNPKLEERIVQYLAHHPSSTAKQLQNSLRFKNQRPYSIQAIYQELRKLVRAGIVLKAGDCFALRLGWVIELMNLSRVMYSSYLKDAGEREYLPRDGGRRIWKFYDLQSLVTFTTHLGLVLLQECGDTPLYEYGPRVWYHLAHRQSEEQFIKAVKLGNFRYVAVIRGNSFLDRSYEELFSDINGKIYFGKTLFGQENDDCNLYVSGNYVTRIKLPELLKKSIDTLYDSITRPSDISVGAISDIFHQRARISVVVAHRPKEAAMLRNKFRRFCGIY